MSAATATLHRVQPLDPIVSLTVAIAEAPGSFAFFLGSGVSRDAGVPTGEEVWWQAVGELWRVQHVEEKTPSRDDLQSWLNETGRASHGYSEILEELAPNQASRRDYLSKLFANATPGRTHEALADLAARGLVRVFVTTNFDRLLEQALQARGIVPVVVTSDADLATAPAREHHPCFVVKPHGDYLQETIRNTSGELESLEPEVARELQAIFNRYGVVVLGYSGSDQAIRKAFKARNSRYGLYWVTRSGPREPARTIIEAAGGRNIQRTDAAEFLADLDRRFTVFSQHPAGDTPVVVHDAMVEMLSRGDTVGARELLRSSHRRLEVALRDARAELEGPTPDVKVLRCFREMVYPALEQRLATLLPLLVHDSALLAEETRALADFRSRRRRGDGFLFWVEVNDFCVRWLGWALGTYAARRQSFAPLRPFLDKTVVDFEGEPSPLIPSFPDEASRALVRTRPEVPTSHRDPTFSAMREDFGESVLLQNRYPELVEQPDDLLASMVEFDMVLSLALGLRNEEWLGSWLAHRTEAQRFAGHLRGDITLRREVAAVCGVPLDQFDEEAADLLEGEAEGRHDRTRRAVVRALRGDTDWK
jgi:hypothetical protein